MILKRANGKAPLIFVCIIIIGLILSSCSDETSIKEDYLLRTQWDQTDLYAKFCPNNDRAGCWSTAIAQILYFHRVLPDGKIEYLTSLGNRVSEDLNSFEFNWDLFVERIDDNSSEESIEQVAKFIYYTSVVLEKDFSTGAYLTALNEYKEGKSYLNVDRMINNLNIYFKCMAKDYHYSEEDLKTYKEEIEKLIIEEIDSNRPVMFYIQSGDNGHACVIDGYSYIDNNFTVHINQGASGFGNEWYDFNKSIREELDDMNHRVLLTIKPTVNSK